MFSIILQCLKNIFYPKAIIFYPKTIILGKSRENLTIHPDISQLDTYLKVHTLKSYLQAFWCALGVKPNLFLKALLKEVVLA